MGIMATAVLIVERSRSLFVSLTYAAFGGLLASR